MAAWRDGLEVLVAAYLDEGHAKRGSLREAVDLVTAHRSTPELGANATENGDANEEARFNPLRLEKMRRSLVRWRRDLGIDKGHSLRLQLATVLRALPSLVDLLEPLADFWGSEVRAQQKEVSEDELISSWTAELVGNLLVLYAGATCDVGRVERKLEAIKRTSDGRDRATLEEPVPLEQCLFDTFDVLEKSDVQVALLPALDRFCGSHPLLLPAALLALCKPLLGSTEAVQSANRALCVQGPAVAGEHVLNMCFEKARGTEIQRTVASAVLTTAKGVKQDALLKAAVSKDTSELSTQLITERVGRAVSLALHLPQVDGEPAHAQPASAQERQTRGWQQQVEDTVLEAEQEVGFLRADLTRALHGLAQVVLEQHKQRQPESEQ